MLTGSIRNQVDRLWDSFWAGGISNPLSVVEQITYLLFSKRLDELETAREKAAAVGAKPEEKPVFGPDQQELRWSRFREFEPQKMYETFRDGVFPFIKSLNGNVRSAYSRFMRDAVFMIPTPNLMQKAVDQISAIPMEDRDTKGDLYEYMLSKLSVAGQAGQFRTPRHIIKMMVELLNPQPEDIIADPACGTAGFLVAAGEYLREQHPQMQHNAKQWEHFQKTQFHGADFDASMLRIGAMNLMLHGIENPDLRSVDSLSESNSDLRERYTLILANPPFKGSLDYPAVAPDLLQTVRTKKTELLFLALFLKQLKPGGRCACIVPDGVLFGSSNAHKSLRRVLVDEQKLDGIISMPSGVFKPYAGVSTAVLIFTRTDSGGTDHVWFYDMQADGFSLDDKRDRIDANDIPDILARWKARDPKAENDRTAQAFFVSAEDIRAQDYDLSINRYKEIVHQETHYDPPGKILDELEALETEILHDLQTLRGMLG